MTFLLSRIIVPHSRGRKGTVWRLGGECMIGVMEFRLLMRTEQSRGGRSRFATLLEVNQALTTGSRLRGGLERVLEILRTSEGAARGALVLDGQADDPGAELAKFLEQMAGSP